MTEDGLTLTPLAGRAAINKNEAITGSVFLAILINIFLLVLVQALNVLLLHEIPALFWTLTAAIIVADGVLCVLVFRRAISDVSVSSSAPPYTIAYRADGYIVLCHKNGNREYIDAREVVYVKASPAKLAFIVNGWAYSGNLNYGKVTFYIAGGLEKPVRKSVRYVANCVQAVKFIRVYLPQSLNGEDSVSA